VSAHPTPTVTDATRPEAALPRALRLTTAGQHGEWKISDAGVGRERVTLYPRERIVDSSRPTERR